MAGSLHARAALLTALSLAALSAPTVADEVTLKDGRKLTGKARWTDQGLELTLEHGAVVFPRQDVLTVVEKELPAEELARRRGALAADDLPGRVALARFGLEHELEADARGLLLQVVERPAPALEQGQEPSEAQRAEADARAEAEALLRTLEFQLVNGKWTSPEEYYPPRGFVKHRGKWVPRAEVERSRALRDRRSAEAEEDKARRGERSAARRADRALDALEEAEDELARAEARVDHYQGEAVRIERLLLAARSELAARERELALVEQEAAAQVSVYDALLLNPCRCPPRSCGCGWETRRQQLLVLVDAVQRRLAEARRVRNEAAARARAHEADLSEANRLLAKARSTRGKAAAEVKARKREVNKREAAVGEAAEKADQAARKVDEADRKVEQAEEELRDPPPPPEEEVEKEQKGQDQPPPEEQGGE
mgnify:CR=1 FL=1